MRLLALVLTTLLAASALADLSATSARRADATAFLQDGLSDPTLLPLLASEPDRVEVDLLAARAMLQDALRPFPETLSVEALQEATGRRADQLAAVRDQASQAAEERPNSWHAQVLLGASTYLERSLRQDRELFTESQDWEEPLLQAIDLYPRSEEPERFLTMAYLEIWPMLSQQKRELTRQLLSDALDDPTTFERYIGPWLTVNDDLDEALSLLPAKPFVWRHMLKVHRESKDWRRYTAAQEALDEARRVEIDSKLSEASQRLELGDLKRGRSLLVEVVGALPVDGTWAETFDRALSQLPPGPIHSVPARNVNAWLQWALEQCAFRDCPLSPTSLQRAAVISVQEADSFRAAALAASGDLVAAEAIANRSLDLVANEWSLYHLLRARAFAAGDRLPEAREALNLFNPAEDLELGYRALKTDLSSLVGVPEPRRSEWRQTLENEWTLDLFTVAELPTIEIPVENLPARGCPLEAWLDGAVIHRSVVTPRRPALVAPLVVPLAGGPHRLAIRSPAGCYFTPSPEDRT